MLGVQSLGHLFHKSPVSLLDALIQEGYVSHKEVADLVGKSNQEVMTVLLEKKLCSPADIAKGYSIFFSLPFVRLGKRNISREILNLIPEQVAREYRVVAYELSGKVLHLAIGAPDKLQTRAPDILSELQRKRNLTISLAVTSANDIDWAFSLYEKEAARAIPKEIVHDAQLHNVEDKAASIPSSGLIFQDLTKITIPQAVLKKFPKEVSEKYKMVVFDVEPSIQESPVPKKIKVALLDSANPQARDILEFIKKRNGIEVEVYQADKAGIEKALAGYPDTVASVLEAAGSSASKTNIENKIVAQAKTTAIEAGQKVIVNQASGIESDLPGEIVKNKPGNIELNQVRPIEQSGNAVDKSMQSDIQKREGSSVDSAHKPEVISKSQASGDKHSSKRQDKNQERVIEGKDRQGNNPHVAPRPIEPIREIKADIVKDDDFSKKTGHDDPLGLLS